MGRQPDGYMGSQPLAFGWCFNLCAANKFTYFTYLLVVVVCKLLIRQWIETLAAQQTLAAQHIHLPICKILSGTLQSLNCVLFHNVKSGLLTMKSFTHATIK